jgi:hypothetical protein
MMTTQERTAALEASPPKLSGARLDGPTDPGQPPGVVVREDVALSLRLGAPRWRYHGTVEGVAFAGVATSYARACEAARVCELSAQMLRGLHEGAA